MKCSECHVPGAIQFVPRACILEVSPLINGTSVGFIFPGILIMG
jgi:hypothetical protein